MSLRVPLRPVGRRQTDAEVYDRVAQAAAATVIRDYSSSFGLACRLLHPGVRGHVRNIYALVRLADEVVDGPLGVRAPQRAAVLLDRLEEDTTEAMRHGYSTNLVVHAFALTARACGIGHELVTPFFASMRADLTVTEHDDVSFARYVHGSAEVVGLMCLRVFLADGTGPTNASYDDLVEGASRLGAAFQKVNFLRDLGADHDLRGRSYFPGVEPTRLTEADKHRILDDVDADLTAAAGAIDLLPDCGRRAVAVAAAVFAELSGRLRATPASDILARRVRVPSTTKVLIALRTSLHERSA